jgi:glutamine synthetase type III
MTDLSHYASSYGIRHFLFSFSDLLGVQRAKLVPAASVDELARSGAGFAGFAAWLDLSPAAADVLAVPDPHSLTRLPWQPQVAWMATDLFLNGAPLEQSPRRVLQRQIARAADSGLELRTGVEAEFFLLDGDGERVADRRDSQRKPCYDQRALMRRYPLIAGLLDAMQELGWGPYQADHEDARGQFELNWTFSDALTTADRHAFFRIMAATLAEQEGLTVSFDPKPFADLTGNGAHLHCSLWDGEGSNRFTDPAGPLGLSQLAYQFLAGVLSHAPALCAFTNPLPSSYQRLGRCVTSSGASWSPSWISYGGNNRTHLVRIPDHQRLEIRLPDGGANPYLLQAAVLAAGLNGIERQLIPPERCDLDLNVEEPPSGTGQLPSSLAEALECLAADYQLRQSLGVTFCHSYLDLMRRAVLDS